MRLLLILMLLLPLAACSKKTDDTSATAAPQAVAPKPATPPSPAVDPLVEKGQYLVNMLGCPQCHTPFTDSGEPDFSKAWAGGLEVAEKFGTWRSANITQDKETGIGDWTDEQIIAAVREGKRPDGEGLFPIMPYLFYSSLSDDDAKALVAYLRTIKPIANKVERAMDLKLPKPPAPPTPAGSAPDGSDPIQRGEYLAGVMHCAMCHSPMDKSGAPDMSKAFSGGYRFELPMLGEGVIYSANLTSDAETGIGEWSEDEIVRTLKEMKKKDGSPIMGPMMLYASGWSKLKDEDLLAIAKFLKSLPAVSNKVPASTFKPKQPPPTSAKPVVVPAKKGQK